MKEVHATKRLWASKRWSLIWGAALLVLTVTLIFTQRQEVARALPILAHADLWVLVITASFECVFFALQAFAARLLYGVYNRKTSVPLLTCVLFIATMINEVLPTSGISGTAGFIYWCDKLGYGLRDSIAVNIWLTILSYLALIPVAGVCLRALTLLPGTPGKLIAGTLELGGLFLLIIIALLYLGYRLANRLPEKQNLEQPTEDMTKRPTIRYYVRQGLHVGWTHFKRVSVSYTSRELSKEWRQVSRHPLPFVISLVLLASIYAVRVVMLRLCLLATGHDLSWSHALFVYCLTLMFSVVSLSPTTLGVVEVALTTALSWFGMPLPVAVAGTVLYRLSSFWFPIPVGLLCEWGLGKQVKWRVKSQS